MAINTGPNFGQEKTDKAVRFYAGYYVVAGATTHQGPTIMMSWPGVLGKIRLFVFGQSMAWGTYEERGGGMEYSILLNSAESDFRYRITGGISYSAENLIGETALPEKLLAIYIGGSVLYDISKKLSLEATLAPAYTSLVYLPVHSLMRDTISKLGVVARVSLKIGL
ncbi:MAG: hypothetical protein HY973_03355 [Candidatus Kerfeldbacteria bacterium]|nr:hypothetical protein [Candidatus Kerfeldbacteria bacterium]